MVRLTLCLLALGAFVVPVAAADPPDAASTIAGTIERTHFDGPSGARPVTFLSTADGPQAVHFAAGQRVPPNGAEVELRGRVAGDVLEETSATITGPTIAVPSGSTIDQGTQGTQGTPLASGSVQTVAIVEITFAGGANPGYSDATLQGVLTTNSNSVSNYFAEQSFGQVSFAGISNPNGDVFHVSIAADGSNCNGGGWQSWGTQATAAVGSSTLAAYNHVIYVVNAAGCGWAGLGFMPGREVYIDNAFVLSVVAHELGHNLGVHHASSLRCAVGGVNVMFSTTGSNCSTSEYGDPFDIMGSSSTNQQDAYHKFQSGWLGSVSGPRVRTITATGDYTVSPLELSSGVALLLVPNVTGPVVGGASLGADFAIDLRQTYGSYFDAFAAGSNAVSGVQLRLVQAPGSGSPIQTQLIDATPQTSTFSDAALLPGNTFTDATDQISIGLVGIDPVTGSATVHVALGADATPPDTTPPTAVSNLSATVGLGSSVTLTFGAATDDRAVAGYRVARDGSQIATLGPSLTTVTDRGAAYGAHTYTVTAVDAANNVGPSVNVGVTLVAPTVPIVPVPTGPSTKLTPTTTPGTGSGDSTGPAPVTVTPTTYSVTVKIVHRPGKKRRALLSWRAVIGATSYTVLRNGHTFKVTRKRTLVDQSPPRGALRYTVRAT